MVCKLSKIWVPQHYYMYLFDDAPLILSKNLCCLKVEVGLRSSNFENRLSLQKKMCIEAL
jgi:hypothetical protein